jgi:hypothetical protein
MLTRWMNICKSGWCTCLKNIVQSVGCGGLLCWCSLQWWCKNFGRYSVTVDCRWITWTDVWRSKTWHRFSMWDTYVPTCYLQEYTYRSDIFGWSDAEDADLKTLAKADKYEKQLVEDTLLYCKDGKLVIPKVSPLFAASWVYLPDWKKPWEVPCIGKVCDGQSEHTSKTVPSQQKTTKTVW